MGLGALVLGGLVAAARPAAAASVPPIPVTGPQSCATMATRFGVPAGTWNEIRFTRPPGSTLPLGQHTITRLGTTITVTINANGTVDFVSTSPVSAVYVNKGAYPTPGSAIYHYTTPVTSDTYLGVLPVKLVGVDHVVLCWGGGPGPTTTIAPTSVLPTSVLPTSVAPPTTAKPTVLPTSVVAPTSGAATTGPGTLPVTGATSDVALAAGALGLAAGLALVTAGRTRQQRD